MSEEYSSGCLPSFLQRGARVGRAKCNGQCIVYSGFLAGMFTVMCGVCFVIKSESDGMLSLIRRKDEASPVYVFGCIFASLAAVTATLTGLACWTAYSQYRAYHPHTPAPTNHTSTYLPPIISNAHPHGQAGYALVPQDPQMSPVRLPYSASQGPYQAHCPSRHQPGQHAYPGHPPYTGQHPYAGHPPFSGQHSCARQHPYPGPYPYARQHPYPGRTSYPGHPPYLGQHHYPVHPPYSDDPPPYSAVAPSGPCPPYSKTPPPFYEKVSEESAEPSAPPP
ncbi:uncharacterized protein LOC143025638 [Oratosquilla oratoria]|uniref:uncharacterized protein LOC143025632 n=1 Tax=Oratosquilla oratoria TaxID=337810 RepID=UPI003F770068